MIGMKVGEYEVGQTVPSQLQTSQSPECASPTVYEHTERTGFDPVGGRSPMRLRNQGPGTYDPYPHGQ